MNCSTRDALRFTCLLTVSTSAVVKVDACKRVKNQFSPENTIMINYYKSQNRFHYVFKIYKHTQYYWNVFERPFAPTKKKLSQLTELPIRKRVILSCKVVTAKLATHVYTSQKNNHCLYHR